MDIKDNQVGGKYDRQLRLWSSNGQQKLSESHVAMINISIAGTELLKNLVLPGVGHITIIDDSLVNEIDISGNFFLNVENLGNSKAKSIAALLNELNEDVEISCVESINNQQWEKFDCVVSCSKPSQSIVDLLWSINTPLLVIDSCGFYGYLKLSFKEISIIETHDNNLEDLRIDNPWEQLKQYVDSIDIDSLDASGFAALPYNILLIKLVDKYRVTEGNQRPTPRIIRDMLTKFKYKEELNVIEASKRATIVLKDSSELPDMLKVIFGKTRGLKIAKDTSLFWVACKALVEFYDKYKVLPLSGVLPDMESGSQQYNSLRNLYIEKNLRDKEWIKTVINSYGREVDDQWLSIFVKNCKYMAFIEGSKESLSLNMWSSVIENNWQIEENLQKLSIYFAFLAMERFNIQHNRPPYLADEDEKVLNALSITDLCLLSDIGGLPKNFDDILNEMFPTILKRTIKEICRAEGKELHNISAIIGGIGAQEVIKIITNQYIPIDNTLVYDGITNGGYTFKI
ncbi:Ula1 protein [Martiniozyma asiatica (nom. inval.)]|nr:Ula1 protein [Martiniozyma asiatica]